MLLKFQPVVLLEPNWSNIRCRIQESVIEFRKTLVGLG